MRPVYSAKNALAGAVAIAMQDGSGNPVAPQAGGFEASNTVDGFPGTVFRPASNTTGRLVFTIPGGATTSCVALVRHRFAADAQVAWEGSNNGSTWTTIAVLTDRIGSPSFFVTYPQATFTYYALRLISIGSATETWQVGEVWAGLHVALSRDVDWGARQGREHRSVGVETEAGVPIDYYLSGNRTMTGEFGEGLTADERDELADFIDAVRGNVGAFLWAPDAASSACYLAKSRVSKYDPRHQGVGRWAGVPLDVFEIPAGREGR